MKKLMFSFLALVFTTSIYAVSFWDEIPENLKKAFQTKFKNIENEDVMWEKSANGYFAFFSEDGDLKYCRFDLKGNWSEVGSENVEIPEAVSDVFSEELDGLVATETYNVTSNKNQKAFLLVGITETEKHILLIAPNGKILRQETMVIEANFGEELEEEDEGDGDSW